MKEIPIQYRQQKISSPLSIIPYAYNSLVSIEY